jgi:hypothetical protein
MAIYSVWSDIHLFSVAGIHPYIGKSYPVPGWIPDIKKRPDYPTGLSGGISGASLHTGTTLFFHFKTLNSYLRILPLGHKRKMNKGGNCLLQAL